MTASQSRPASPLVWPAVAVLVIVAGTLCALYALAPSSAKPDTGPLFAALPAALAALGTVVVGVAQRITAAEHGQKLDKISSQTNGVLDKRILDGASAAVAAAIPAIASAVTAQVHGQAQAQLELAPAAAVPAPRLAAGIVYDPASIVTATASAPPAAPDGGL
jgi:hypothetical protein